MRIRKNAKKSDFLYTNTNFSSEALHTDNMCQLNQSPWDIITFPSSDSPSSLHRFDKYEVCYNVNYAENGSSIDSFEHLESVALKTLRSGENHNGRKNDYLESLGCKKKRKSNKIEEEVKLCDKLDNKGWQCGKVVKKGNTMCDHHVSELQNYAVWTTKKKPDSLSGPTTGCRPHRPRKRPTSNPHEFYYYTGFGPSWGKKRGSSSATVGSNNSNTGYETSGIDNDVEYSDDDKKGKMGITGKKKGRKPVKERSLKSLM